VSDNDRVPSALTGQTHAVSSCPPQVRLRLDIAYDGTDFAGWAFQPGQRTVAGELQAGLARLFSAPRGLTVAGRTDAGVHASGQVAHVDVPVPEWERYADGLLWRLRGILPADIRIHAVREVPDQFNARFAALSRRYEYRVSDARWGVHPLRRNDTVAWPRPVEVAAMNAAAAVLLGEHDFAAFCKRREGATTIRALNRVDWHRDTADVLIATVVADAFCHSMVRSLVGAMLAVGDGRRDADWLRGLLRLEHRSGAVVVAPAHGLTLVAVEYSDDPAQWALRQTETRRMRTLSGPGGEPA
jgi:tRNA pseudouridine38-40 synthase